MTGIIPETWLPALVFVLALIVEHAGPAPAALAADPPEGPGRGTVPSDPVFTALRTDLTTLTGRIRQIGPREITLVPAEGEAQVIPLDRLVKLSREDMPPAVAPDGMLVLWPSGDRLYRCVITSATETALEVQSSALDHVTIPLDSVLGLVLSPPSDVESLDLLLTRIRSEPRSSEVLWLANGDRLTGLLLGIDDKKIKFQPNQNPIDFDFSGIIAVGFDPALAVYPQPKGDYLELSMADGSRLGVTQARFEQGQIVGTTRFGATIHLALSELAQVHARTSSVVYLSDRPADADHYVAYLGPTRPYRREGNVEGHALRLAGQTFDRGLGTQSRTLLAYRLAPGDRRFQVLVGLDDSAGALGSVVFRVRVDDRERLVTPPMSVRDTPRTIDLDVSGARWIILDTDFGERGDVRDFADWVEARIIR
jgi:hypothetical protein